MIDTVTVNCPHGRQLVHFKTPSIQLLIPYPRMVAHLKWGEDRASSTSGRSLRRVGQPILGCAPPSVRPNGRVAGQCSLEREVKTRRWRLERTWSA